MIKILKALKKDSLEAEWRHMDISHYGRKIHWCEKKFRFKAVEKGKLVGYIDGEYQPGIVYVETLITVEKARGKGIGTKLINKAEGFGKKYGAHKVWLITGEDWSENKFYQKLGFRLIGNLPDFYFHKDFVIYEKLI